MKKDDGALIKPQNPKLGNLLCLENILQGPPPKCNCRPVGSIYSLFIEDLRCSERGVGDGGSLIGRDGS